MKTNIIASVRDDRVSKGLKSPSLPEPLNTMIDWPPPRFVECWECCSVRFLSWARCEPPPSLHRFNVEAELGVRTMRGIRPISYGHLLQSLGYGMNTFSLITLRGSGPPPLPQQSRALPGRAGPNASKAERRVRPPGHPLLAGC